MRDLAELRIEIDEIDKQMVELFERRMDVSREVAEYKVATGKRILDKERENQKLEAVKKMTHNAFNSHGVEELFKQLMAMSRKLQYQQMEEQATQREAEVAVLRNDMRRDEEIRQRIAGDLSAAQDADAGFDALVAQRQERIKTREEEIRKHVADTIAEYHAGGHWIPSINDGLPIIIHQGNYDIITDEINKQEKLYFK